MPIKSFKKIDAVEPPKDLSFRILSAIETEARRSGKNKFIFFGSLSVISLIFMIPAFQYFIQEFYISGFYSYISILFSDTNTVLALWKEFSIAIMESLPVFGITVFLSATFIFLESFKIAAENFSYSNFKIQLN